MHINTVNSLNKNKHTKIEKKINFTGHVGSPIQDIYIRPNNSKEYKIVSQLSTLGQKFGFNLKVHDCNGITSPKKSLQLKNCFSYKNLRPWLQDDVIFLNTNEILNLAEKKLFNTDNKKTVSDLINKLHSPKVKIAMFSIEGGNVFLGRKPSGEKFAIIGENVIPDRNSDNKHRIHSELGINGFEGLRYNDNEIKTKLKSKVTQQLNIKEDNIVCIPNYDYHIDLSITPLGKNNLIIINDFDKTDQLLKKIAKTTQVSNNSLLVKIFDKLIKANKDYKRVSAEKYQKTIQILENNGFNLIKLPASLRVDKVIKDDLLVDFEDEENEIKSTYIFNFINSIIHHQKNGNLAIITNSSNVSLKSLAKSLSIEDEDNNVLINNNLNEVLGQINIDNLFQKNLKEDLEIKYPKMKYSLDYISGENDIYIGEELINNKGGIHCRTTVVPTFSQE